MRSGLVALLLGALLLAGCGSSESHPSTQLEAEERTTEELKDPGTQGPSAETSGEENTPCHAEYSLKAGALTVTVSSEEEGDIGVKPAVDGHYRHEQVVKDIDANGAIPSVTFEHVSSVERIVTTLDARGGGVHFCSVSKVG
ncbi:MAG TPA: hypothetical protein VN889_05350 [Solirubrobacteraceae bacterium]|nr:hypothetical protein [Solirubrobacteraceae bacterium]